MKTAFRFLLACSIVSLSAVAQNRTELDQTCVTLAKLTENALGRNSVVEVLVYIRAAGFIRVKNKDATTCQAVYFAKVVSENAEVLAGAAAIISAGAVKPVKGWTHHELDEFFTAVDGLTPTTVIANTKFQRANPALDLTKLRIDYENLKANHPELFKNPAPSIRDIAKVPGKRP